MKNVLRNPLEFTPSNLFGTTNARVNNPSTRCGLVGNLV